MYGGGLLGNFDAMRMTLLIGGIICAVIGVVLYAVGKKKDEKMAMPTKITVTIGGHEEEI